MLRLKAFKFKSYEQAEGFVKFLRSREISHLINIKPYGKTIVYVSRTDVRSHKLKARYRYFRSVKEKVDHSDFVNFFANELKTFDKESRRQKKRSKNLLD